MTRINSFEALKKYRKEILRAGRSVDEIRNSDGLVTVKVATATCSNAAGAMDILEFMAEELDKRGVDAIVTKTGCMGYCYAEPTVEVTLPGNDPVVFGFVDERRADEIIENYIKKGELVEGVIPVNYRKVEEV